MSRRGLPIGIQTFREIREASHYYVDKTPHIERLLDDGKHFFLSRPRRFGKSLLLDTLKELFEGSEALFGGLAIHGAWDWSQRHPVVRLDFSRGDFTTPGYLHANVMAQLDSQERAHGVVGRYDTAPERLGHLLEALHRRDGKRAVVLIDECDRPMLEALQDPDLARANRGYLRGLYANVKYADAHIRFSLITGVSKFSKVSLFSGLNNLTDITIDPQYSAICGYTEADLETVFAPELKGLDRGEIRDWYNGYCWLGAERVYNPFGILLLFRSRKFESHWFETGTPKFLVDTLLRRRVRSVDLDGMLATNELLSTFDVDAIAPEALLFQTGYLTILREEPRAGETFYRLGYPNREVRQGLNRSLLSHMVGDASQRTAPRPAAGRRSRRPARPVPRLLRQYSPPVVHQQRYRPVRGLLRQRVLLLLRGSGAGRHGGGQHQPGAAGHGPALRGPGLRVRVQGGGAGGRGYGDGPAQAAGLRGQASGRGRRRPSGGGGVQQPGAQHRVLRDGARVSSCASRRCCSPSPSLPAASRASAPA